MSTGISRYSKDAIRIRSQLRLRYNMLYSCYEVYTCKHGSGELFRWHMITDEVCEWYKKQFNLTVDSYLQPSHKSGGLIEIQHKDLGGTGDNPAPESQF